jgi:hypothetical protein
MPTIAMGRQRLSCISTAYYASAGVRNSVDETRWDEKAGLRTGCRVCSQVIDVLEAQIKRIPAMKKSSAAVAKQNRDFSQQKLTI